MGKLILTIPEDGRCEVWDEASATQLLVDYTDIRVQIDGRIVSLNRLLALVRAVRELPKV